MPISVLPVPDHEEGRVRVAAAIWPRWHSAPSDILIRHQELQPEELGQRAAGEVGDIRVALPLWLSGRRRRQFLKTLRAIPGAGLSVAVDAPVAAYAITTAAAAESDLDAVVLGQPDGSFSVVIGHRASARLLSIGVATDRASARHIFERATRALVNATGGADAEAGRGRDHPEPSVIANTFGVEDARIGELAAALGNAEIERWSDSAVTVGLAGLRHLDRLNAWSAAWPTVRTHVGDGWTRQPGPLRPEIEVHRTTIGRGATVRFSDLLNGRVRVEAGSVVAEGCMIPNRIGSQPTIELSQAGELRIRGAGRGEFGVQLGWPIPGSGNRSVRVRSTGPLGVELLHPESRRRRSAPVAESRVRPEAVENVEPQFGRQA